MKPMDLRHRLTLTAAGLGLVAGMLILACGLGRGDGAPSGRDTQARLPRASPIVSPRVVDPRLVVAFAVRGRLEVPPARSDDSVGAAMTFAPDAPSDGPDELVVEAYDFLSARLHAARVWLAGRDRGI